MIYVPYETKDKNSTHGIPEPCLDSTLKTDVTCFQSSSELGHGDTARGGGVDNFAGVSFDSDITTDGIINAKKNEEVFDDTRPIPLKTDVYAFIAVAPVWSAPFAFALYVILLKYTVVGLLIYGIQFNTGDKSSKKDDTVKFFLIPVAIAMQDDLMYFYASIANVRYEISPTLQRISDQTSITKGKLIVGLLLRFIDGALNLYANFALMISTAGVLNIFLNFAALHFLQGIDDVFFSLVEQGFYGDTMEHMSYICKKITFPRRKNYGGCVTELDTTLFVCTFILCLVIYGLYLSSFSLLSLAD